MKFALFTGCVAKGATRELMLSTHKAAEGLGFDFVEMKSASCCGAGVVSEKSPLLADALKRTGRFRATLTTFAAMGTVLSLIHI